MTTVLQTNNLSKKYKDTYALKDCSINVEQGEIFGIVGPNGAGKSTLLKLLSGITNQTEGSIEIFGDTNLPKQRSRMSSIVENPTLFTDLSAAENLEYFRIQRGVADKHRIYEVLDEVGLKNRDNKPVKKYSVGMKQRLALALALLTNPDIMILDEPTSGIDPAGIVEVRHMLQKLNKEKGVTIIISSHILTEMSNLCTKIAIIDKGIIKDQLTMDELYEKSSEYIELKATDTEKTVTILEEKFNIQNYEIKPDETIFIYEKLDELVEMNKAIVNAGIGVEKLLKEHQTLEEYYLSITDGNKND